MTHPVRLYAHAAFGVSVFMFGSASSCDAGDRASGGCPSGEVCDPATEDGLHFGGATIGEGLFDVGDVKLLAIGGRQDVRLFEVDEDGTHVDFTLPYNATFDTSAVSIEAKSGNVVTLRGDADQDGHLRILSPDTGQLFDRIRVSSRAIANVRLAPTLNILIDGEDETDNPLYAPGATGYVRLEDDRGSALVDEDATISGTTQTRWDRFVVGALAPGIHSLTVTAGDHAPVTVAYEVGHADTLVHLLGGDVARNGNAFVCFGAHAGARRIHAAWTFEADGGTVEASNYAGCAYVTPGTGTQVVVRAFADGLQTSITLPIVDTSANAFADRVRMARAVIAANAFQVTSEQAGERAAMRR